MSDFWIPEDDPDFNGTLDLGIDRHADVQAHNEYRLFVEEFERVMAAPVVHLADGSCLQISDRGQLDLGIIREHRQGARSPVDAREAVAMVADPPDSPALLVPMIGPELPHDARFFWWKFVHNALIHPCLSLPWEPKWAQRAHDWTAARCYGAG